MPIYEYRCPNGHLFERFQSMTAAAPETCDACGAAPLELVLYPIAIHYKGSGFYSTDYGKRKIAQKDGGGGDTSSTSSDTPAKTETSKQTPSEKKSAPSSGD